MAVVPRVIGLVPRLAIKSPIRTEKDVGLACDIVASTCGWTVERYEQQRATRICAGLPDRRYVHRGRGLRLWVELKRPGGKLTVAQWAWLTVENASGGLGAVIDDEMTLVPLLRLLARASSIADGEARRTCQELVALCALRGYRAEPVASRRKKVW